MLTSIEAASAAGYSPPEAGVRQVRLMARQGRLPGATESTSGWKIPEDCVPIIAAAKGNVGNKTGKRRRRMSS